MKSGDVGALVVLLIVAALFVTLVSYTVGHEKGYNKGAKHSQIYYQETGEFPSEDWLSYTEGSHLDYREQLLETFERYAPTERKLED